MMRRKTRRRVLKMLWLLAPPIRLPMMPMMMPKTMLMTTRMKMKTPTKRLQRQLVPTPAHRPQSCQSW